jgi:heat shock protein beta
VLLDTARLRSGFTLSDSVSFAQRIERMVRLSVGVAVDEPVSVEIPVVLLRLPRSSLGLL